MRGHFYAMAAKSLWEAVGDYQYNSRDLIGHGAFAVVFKGRHSDVSHLQTFLVVIINVSNLQKHCLSFLLLVINVSSDGLTLIVGTQKWGFSCKVQRRPPADIFLNESLLPKAPLWTPCSWPPWPWFSGEKPLKIFKVL